MCSSDLIIGMGGWPGCWLACEDRGNDQHLGADGSGNECHAFKRTHDGVSFLLLSHYCDAVIPIKLVCFNNRKDCADGCSFCIRVGILFYCSREMLNLTTEDSGEVAL